MSDRPDEPGPDAPDLSPPALPVPGEQPPVRDTDDRQGRYGLVITREALADGSLLARIRARQLPGFTVRSDAEIAASLAASLAPLAPGEDAWVFAYGSLMWNPAFLFAERRPARLLGRQRRFCLSIEFGRGSPEAPGLMLALDDGGECEGIAYRVEAARAAEELLLVWRREMAGDAYAAEWVTLETASGPLRALTFVVRHAARRYAGDLGQAETVRRLATASGELGSCRAYLQHTVDALRALGIRDEAMEMLHEAVGRVASGEAKR